MVKNGMAEKRYDVSVYGAKCPAKGIHIETSFKRRKDAEKVAKQLASLLPPYGAVTVFRSCRFQGRYLYEKVSGYEAPR